MDTSMVYPLVGSGDWGWGRGGGGAGVGFGGFGARERRLCKYNVHINFHACDTL